MAYKATGRPIQPPESTADLITVCAGPPAEPGEHGGRDGRHCSCHDEDDALPCCSCGQLPDDYEDLPADEVEESGRTACDLIAEEYRVHGTDVDRMTDNEAKVIIDVLSSLGGDDR